MSKNAVPKIDLLMTILKKLDAGETITASCLASDLEVTERSIYRYLETLQVAGYPIYFDRNRKSYRFVDSYKLQYSGSSQDLSSALELKKQMLHSSSVGIATYKTDGTCVLVNSALTRMLNATRQQLLGQNFNRIDSWVKSGLLEIVREAISKSEERSTDIHLVSSFGKEIWANCVITPFSSDGEDFVFIMAQDISARKQNELALSAFAASIDKGPSLIMITDTSGTIEYVSGKIELITGYRAEEVLGRKPDMFRSGCTPERTYQNLWETISGGLEWAGELCNRRKDGSVYWEYLRISPIFDENNEIRRYVAVKEDVTRHKQLEDELYRLATRDGLTGMYNKRMVMELVQRELHTIRRHNDTMSVVLIDIDRLKKINHDYGHEAGDAVLLAVAEACRRVLRKSDIVGRTGSDEFAVVLTGVGAEQAMDTAKRLLGKVLDAPVLLGGNMIDYTVSIGVVAGWTDFSDEQTGFEQLLDLASMAARAAMRAGTNRICSHLELPEYRDDKNSGKTEKQEVRRGSGK